MNARQQREQERQVAIDDRPLCECHGEPMYRDGFYPNGSSRPLVCAVRVRGHRKRAYDKDPAAARAHVDAWRIANPEKQKIQGLRQKGVHIELEQYHALLEKFDNKCGICGTPPGDKPGTRTLSVDHDHNTGEVRGLLCRVCNAGIGFLGDTTELLWRAIEYLEGVENPST